MNKKFKSIVLKEIYLFHAKLSFIMPNWYKKRKKLRIFNSFGQFKEITITKKTLANNV